MGGLRFDRFREFLKKLKKLVKTSKCQAEIRGGRYEKLGVHAFCGFSEKTRKSAVFDQNSQNQTGQHVVLAGLGQNSCFTVKLGPSGLIEVSPGFCSVNMLENSYKTAVFEHK